MITSAIISKILTAINEGCEVEVTHPEYPEFLEHLCPSVTGAQIDKQLEEGFEFYIKDTSLRQPLADCPF